MSNRTVLLAEQRLHTGVSLHAEHHLNGHASGSQETSVPPPVYAISDPFSQLDSDAKDVPPEIHANVELADSPAQLPFDNHIGGSHPLATTLPHHQGSLESPMADLRLENQSKATHKGESHTSQQQQQSTDFRQSIQRPELPHTSRSMPDTRRLLGKISEHEEVDPFGESPFEAARRAQRQADRDAAKSASPSGQAYANGRVPSIMPGEIMPSQFLRPTNGLPSFFPPPEAPPFPPTMHAPIRPAHFPSNLHPPPATSEPVWAPQRHFHMPQVSRPHMSHISPSPPQPVPPAPPKPAPARSYGQPPRELLRSRSQPVVPRSSPPEPVRSHSHQTRLHPDIPQYQEYTTAPPPLRRHTLNAHDGVSPSLAANARYPIAQPPPSVPQTFPPPHHLPGLPSRSQSQHHPRSPPSRSQSEHHHQLPPRSNLPDPHHQSLQTPPSQIQLAPRNPFPVRLPSQNIPTPQALGVIHTPPTQSGSLLSDNLRPPRATPKPVMPQLLAPRVAQEPNFARGGTTQLQRSVSSAAIAGEKGGFLAKTKSILRKRTSATVKTHGNGTISFSPTPTMPNLVEENNAEGRKLGNKLNRKK